MPQLKQQAKHVDSRVPRRAAIEARLTELANGAGNQEAARNEIAIYNSPKGTVFQTACNRAGNTRTGGGAEGNNKNGSDFHSLDKGSLVDSSVRRMAGGWTLGGLHLV